MDKKYFDEKLNIFVRLVRSVDADISLSPKEMYAAEKTEIDFLKQIARDGAEAQRENCGQFCQLPGLCENCEFAIQSATVEVPGE